MTDERRSYRASGYQLIDQVVPDSFLSAVQELLEQLVEERIAMWLATGLIHDRYSDLSFRTRYHVAWQAAGRPQERVAGYEGLFVTDRFTELAQHSWLIDLIADVLEVDAVAALQSSFGRAKFPHDECSNLPWHQDASCLDPISGVDFVTVWIPLFDVPAASPCLDISPVGDDRRVFEPRWAPGLCYMCMHDVDVANLREVREISMRRGDLLLLSPFIPHRSVTNVCRKIRWSVDFRFAPT